ncbi:MAG: protein-methionine-sulfoxide reductase catalytic subunit MsrP [Acidobacteriota bacterium]
MAPSIQIRKPWEIPGLRPTSETAFLDRRRFLKQLGRASAGIAGFGALPLAAGGPVTGCARGTPGTPGTRANPATGAQAEHPEPSSLAPIAAERNPRYELDRPLTDEAVAARYNNFYEFTEIKERVAGLARNFRSRPWTVEVAGEVGKPQTFDPDDLLRLMPIEERLYRFRCVEAWAMAVPWVGFPLKALLDRVEPLSSAKFVRMLSFHDPKQAPNQRPPTRYPWPYFEGLTMAEATNPLTLMAIGVYGHELPPQHGAPLRLVVPWKYGFKSIKSVVRIELTQKQPPTFWNRLTPHEYDFRANVDPQTPHPRWSQATERMIDTGDMRPTLKYNGYADLVARLYET